METLGKQNANSKDEKPGKSTSDAVEYLREKSEAEKDLRKEELEMKRNEQQIMIAQMKMIQEQNNAMLAILIKKV